LITETFHGFPLSERKAKEYLTSKEMKQVVAHFASLIRFNSLEKSLEADQFDLKMES